MILIVVVWGVGVACGIWFMQASHEPGAHMEDTLASLARDREHFRILLEKYAQHDWACTFDRGRQRPCTCGLDEAMRSLTVRDGSF